MIEPDNAKGLFRAKKAQIAIKDLEIKSLEQCRGVDPLYEHVFNAGGKSSITA
jgi:hypothetical protein